MTVAAARAPSSLPQPLRERFEEGIEPSGCRGASATSSPLQPRGYSVFFRGCAPQGCAFEPPCLWPFGLWNTKGRVSTSETSPMLPGPLSCAAPCGLRIIPVARCHLLHLCSHLGRNTQWSCREGSRSDAGAPVGFTHAALEFLSRPAGRVRGIWGAMLLLSRSENRTNDSAAADDNSVMFTLEEMLGIFPQRTKN